MPKDYIHIFFGLQEFSVLGWKDDKSGVVVEVMWKKCHPEFISGTALMLCISSTQNV